ncbi:hypothetical protein [Brevundimonas sp.]|uniref:hypothetical protein n=1 Tax=Brevundimonas sp. TaxID=1871086 RepID=UPI0035AF5164
MTRLALFAAAGLALAAAACAPTQTGPMYGGAMSRDFNAADFAWSQQAGQSAIAGVVRYSDGGQAYRCAGSVGLNPVTPYTRHRFNTLYGSIERAAVPASVVRARTVEAADPDYPPYVRSTACDADGRFAFRGLPAGEWFVIAPVQAGGGEPVVLMRRVVTRSNGTAELTLN